MEKYINKLISLGMNREDAEIFIDGLSKVILKNNRHPIHAILPIYYKIRMTKVNTKTNEKEVWGCIKLKSGLLARFYDIEHATRTITFLNEQDTFRRYNYCSNKNISEEQLLSYIRNAYWYNDDLKEWDKSIRSIFITQDGSKFNYNISTEWSIEENQLIEWETVPVYEDEKSH